MTRKLVQLVTHQPVFNLLSFRAIKPDAVLFVGTPQEHSTIDHLKHTLRKEVDVHTLDVHDPFDPVAIHQDVEKELSRLKWEAERTIFDLSGGNKVMAFGVFTLAQKVAAVLADIERIDRDYRLRIYHFRGEHAVLKQDTVLPSLFSLDDYLNAHLPGFHVDGFSSDDRGRIDDGGAFEETLYHAIKPVVDEIVPGLRPGGMAEQVEIDLVVRRGNSVGLIEAKTGVKKAGIDQLNTAANPMLLGLYAKKLLITGRRLPRAHHVLATAQQIHVIELPGYYPGRGLRRDEHNRLQRELAHIL